MALIEIIERTGITAIVFAILSFVMVISLGIFVIMNHLKNKVPSSMKRTQFQAIDALCMNVSLPLKGITQIDGYSFEDDDLICLMGQKEENENGLYRVKNGCLIRFHSKLEDQIGCLVIMKGNSHRGKMFIYSKLGWVQTSKLLFHKENDISSASDSHSILLGDVIPSSISEDPISLKHEMGSFQSTDNDTSMDFVCEPF